jgi:hypothetical protein
MQSRADLHLMSDLHLSHTLCQPRRATPYFNGAGSDDGVTGAKQADQIDRVQRRWE